MKIMEYLKTKSPRHMSHPSENTELLDIVNQTLKEWQLCKDQFNYVDNELIDYMVYRLNAAEKHYLALLALARSKGVKAWPDSLKSEVRNVNPDLNYLNQQYSE